MMENIRQNSELLKRYLTLSIRKQFGLDIDLTDEYTFTENLVSKKTIIAPTFSEKILLNQQIKLYLNSIITEINYGNCTIESIKSRVRNQKETDSEQTESFA